MSAERAGAESKIPELGISKNVIGLHSQFSGGQGNAAYSPVRGVIVGGGIGEYLTTPEAAEYLRKSTSWLLHQADIPYLSGNPNIYKRKDLDAWFDRRKIRPRLEV